MQDRKNSYHETVRNAYKESMVAESVVTVAMVVVVVVDLVAKTLVAVVVASLQEDGLVVDCSRQQRWVVDESRNPMVVEPMKLVEVLTSECRSELGAPVLENEAGWLQ